MNTIEQNKTVVKRFNKEVIEQANYNSFKELVSDHVVNHAAAPGAPSGPESMMQFFQNILHKGFSNIKVQLFEQVAEGDLVTTRKLITAKHHHEVLGIPATNKEVQIKVIDIIRVKDGKYAEHWAASNFSDVMAEISAQ